MDGKPVVKATVRGTGAAFAEPGGYANTGVHFGDVYLASPPARPARSAYLHQVELVSPGELIGRETELAELARFCTAEDGPPYVWWQGPAWAGKSALMAWFVRNPPDGVRVVSFFVTARWAGQSDRTAFLTAVIEQLAEAAGQPMPDFLVDTTGLGWFNGLLQDAARTCAAAGDRLVLVVDGLDEDRGVTAAPDGHSIAALLPANPPQGVRVVVAGRPDPPVPRDVPAWHPLRSQTIVRTLSVSSQAQIIRDDAERELDRLLDSGGPEHDLLGFVTAAGGGLSSADLGDLTGLPERLVVRHLRAVSGRTFQRHHGQRESASASAVFTLAHEELRLAAVDQLGAAELSRYREMLHSWAERYRALGWPRGGPEYLLRRYGSLLLEEGDPRRLSEVIGDAARHDLMRGEIHGDAAAVAETEGALRLLEEHPGPSAEHLTSIALLSLERTRLLGRHIEYAGVELPLLWATLGDWRRARSVCEAIASTTDRADATLRLAGLAADNGEPERALELCDTAQSLTTASSPRDMKLLVELTRLLTPLDRDRAVRCVLQGLESLPVYDTWPSRGEDLDLEDARRRLCVLSAGLAAERGEEDLLKRAFAAARMVGVSWSGGHGRKIETLEAMVRAAVRNGGGRTVRALLEAAAEAAAEAAYPNDDPAHRDTARSYAARVVREAAVRALGVVPAEERDVLWDLEPLNDQELTALTHGLASGGNPQAALAVAVRIHPDARGHADLRGHVKSLAYEGAPGDDVPLRRAAVLTAADALVAHQPLRALELAQAEHPPGHAVVIRALVALGREQDALRVFASVAFRDGGAAARDALADALLDAERYETAVEIARANLRHYEGALLAGRVALRLTEHRVDLAVPLAAEVLARDVPAEDSPERYKHATGRADAWLSLAAAGNAAACQMPPDIARNTSAWNAARAIVAGIGRAPERADALTATIIEPFGEGGVHALAVLLASSGRGRQAVRTARRLSRPAALTATLLRIALRTAAEDPVRATELGEEVTQLLSSSTITPDTAVRLLAQAAAAAPPSTRGATAAASAALRWGDTTPENEYLRALASARAGSPEEALSRAGRVGEGRLDGDRPRLAVYRALFGRLAADDSYDPAPSGNRSGVAAEPTAADVVEAAHLHLWMHPAKELVRLSAAALVDLSRQRSDHHAQAAGVVRWLDDAVESVQYHLAGTRPEACEVLLCGLSVLAGTPVSGTHYDVRPLGSRADLRPLARIRPVGLLAERLRTAAAEVAEVLLAESTLASCGPNGPYWHENAWSDPLARRGAWPPVRELARGAEALAGIDPALARALAERAAEYCAHPVLGPDAPPARPVAAALSAAVAALTPLRTGFDLAAALVDCGPCLLPAATEGLASCEAEHAADLAREAVHALNLGSDRARNLNPDTGVPLSLAVAFASADEWPQAVALLMPYQHSGPAFEPDRTWPEHIPNPFIWTEYADRLLTTSSRAPNQSPSPSSALHKATGRALAHALADPSWPEALALLSAHAPDALAPIVAEVLRTCPPP